MKTKLLVMFASMLLAMPLMPAGASAAVLYATVVQGQFVGADPGGSTVGTEFTVKSSFTVYQLGVFDTGSDGLAQAHPVGIYNTAGVLLATVTVPSGTAASLDSGFRWASLTTPLTLNAGTTYILGAWYSTNADTFGNTATINSNFTLVKDRYFDGGGGLTFPNLSWNNSSALGWYGPNMATPIPAAVWLLGSGLVGLVAFRHRLRK
jgi:hypothetical protein